MNGFHLTSRESRTFVEIDGDVTNVYYDDYHLLQLKKNVVQVMYNPIHFKVTKDRSNAFYILLLFLKPTGYHLARGPLTKNNMAPSFEETKYLYMYDKYRTGGMIHPVFAIKCSIRLQASLNESFKNAWIRVCRHEGQGTLSYVVPSKLAEVMPTGNLYVAEECGSKD